MSLYVTLVLLHDPMICVHVTMVCNYSRSPPDYDEAAKPSVFTEVLRPRFPLGRAAKKTIQVRLFSLGALLLNKGLA